MKVSAITEIANGDIDTEVSLLEKQAETISDDIEIYIRLSSLYRLKGNYEQAWAYLNKAEKLL
ncbi:MAG TPA: hypothetical protein VF622_12005 [Segetibacter sp.]|jgi:tetratricopeptide (TPR) repeat protein